VANGWQTVQPSPIALTLNGFARDAKPSTLENGEIWLRTPSVVLQFIFAVFRFVVCIYLYTKSIRSHSDHGKITKKF